MSTPLATKVQHPETPETRSPTKNERRTLPHTEPHIVEKEKTTG